MSAQKKPRVSSVRLEQRFIQEMMSSSTVVPDLLLSSYEQLGLTAEELIWVLKIIRLQKNRDFLSLEDLPQLLYSTSLEVEERVQVLEEKTILSRTAQKNCIILDPLFSALFDLWAFSQMGSLKRNAEKAKEPAASAKSPFARLYRSFEKELGRGLSPIENEKISQWLAEDKYAADLVEEALRRAVLMGKRSFAYIDKILQSWSERGISSLAEVAAESSDFNAKKASIPIADKERFSKGKAVVEKAKKTEYSSVYDKILK